MGFCGINKNEKNNKPQQRSKNEKNKYNTNDVYADCKNQYLVRADGTIRNVGYVEITKFTVFANNIKEARAIARKKRLLNKKEAA
jgi:hypothetical protein